MREQLLSAIARRMSDLEERVPGTIDKPEEYGRLDDMFWRIVEHRYTEEELSLFLLDNPKLSKYMKE